MEQIINYPTPNFSYHENQVHAEPVCLNKKRKFSAEQLGLPLPKHKSLPISYLESGSIINVNDEQLNASVIEVEFIRLSSNDTTQSRSTKDRNSFSEFNDLTMYISGHVSNDIWHSKASVPDQPSTLSVNWPSTCSMKSLCYFESRSITKSGSSSDEAESSYNTCTGRDLDRDNFGSHSSPYCDKADIEYISHADYICPDFSNQYMEQCTEAEDQDVTTWSNHVISSGRWPVNEDSEQGTRKRTIDKEFEQYFSSLML